jgi:hypothetical protein
VRLSGVSAALVSAAFVSACGRIGFEATSDGAPPDVTATPISWVKTFAAQWTAVTPMLTYTFQSAASAAGDAIVLEVFCQNTTAPTGVTLSAPGWTFTQLGALVGSTANLYWGTSFGAIAPNTASATFTATWTAPASCSYLDALGDEFAGADPTGGVATFDAHAEASSVGNCATSVTTKAANEAVWAACSVGMATGPGATYTKSADDGDGDWSEYKLTSDAANSIEAVEFVTTTGTAPYVVAVVTIHPG